MGWHIIWILAIIAFDIACIIVSTVRDNKEKGIRKKDRGKKKGVNGGE